MTGPTRGPTPGEGIESDRPDPTEPHVGSLPERQFDADGETKTGTTTVGLTTADGVVMATDKRASLRGGFVANRNVQKVEQVHPTAAITMAGSVGGAQSFIRILRAEANLFESRRGEPMSINALGTLAGNLLRGRYRINPILGGLDEAGPHVYSVDPAGGVLSDDYTVTGSGMQLAYGVLEQEYETEMAPETARTVAARAVESATQRDTASGDGLFLAEVTADGVDIEDYDDYDEVL